MVFGSCKLNYYQIKQHIIMSNFAAFKHTIEQIDFSQFLFGYDYCTCIGRVTML